MNSRVCMRRYASSNSNSNNSSGKDSMFKGAPTFKKVPAKNKRLFPPKSRGASKSGAADWSTSHRIELNRRNVGRLVFLGATAATCIGLVGFGVYCVGTYNLVRAEWPAPPEIKSIMARSQLYLASYYENFSPNYDRALSLLEKALVLILKEDALPHNSLGMLDIKLRVGECLFNLGECEKAAKLVAPLMPVLQEYSRNEWERYESTEQDDDDKQVDVLADRLLHRLVIVLGQTGMEAERYEAAKKTFGIGIQAAKRIKRDVVNRFDSNNLANYTVFDSANAMEAVLTLQLGEAYYGTKDRVVAQTLFETVLNSFRQHKAQLEMVPRVIENPRVYKDEWICLDNAAMVSLARIKVDAGQIDDAMPWLDAANKMMEGKSILEVLPARCVPCISDLLRQRARIAEIQGDTRRALGKYREAYEFTRLNFGNAKVQADLLSNIERLQRTK